MFDNFKWQLNFEANDAYGLIDWQAKNIMEPPLTTDFTDEHINTFEPKYLWVLENMGFMTEVANTAKVETSTALPAADKIKVECPSCGLLFINLS